MFLTEGCSRDGLVNVIHSQVWERMKLVIEPSAACPLAVVLSQQFESKIGAEVKKVGVVFSGGNVDLNHLPWIK